MKTENTTFGQHLFVQFQGNSSLEVTVFPYRTNTEYIYEQFATDVATTTAVRWDCEEYVWSHQPANLIDFKSNSGDGDVSQSFSLNQERICSTYKLYLKLVTFGTPGSYPACFLILCLTAYRNIRKEPHK